MTNEIPIHPSSFFDEVNELFLAKGFDYTKSRTAKAYALPKWDYEKAEQRIRKTIEKRPSTAKKRPSTKE